MLARRTGVHQRRLFVEHFAEGFEVAEGHGIGCTFKQEVGILVFDCAALTEFLFDGSGQAMHAGMEAAHAGGTGAGVQKAAGELFADLGAG